MSVKQDSTVTTLADLTEHDLRARLLAAEIPDYAVAQLAAALRHARDKGWGVKTLAMAIGLQPGSLSEMFNAKYKGNYVTRCRLIERYLVDLEKRSLFGGRDEFVETPLAKSLWMICERTRYSRRIQIIQSEEQCGKSTAAREYAHRNNGGRTILVTLKPGAGSRPMTIFLRDLATAAGVKSVENRKLVGVRYELREALEMCDLVIIDEVHLLESWSEKDTRDFLDYLRIELYQDGKRGVILQCTNNDLLTILDDFRRAARYNLGQLLGRMCNEVIDISPDDIEEEDVRLLVGRYLERPAKATLAKLCDIATRPRLGHFGLLCDILNRAWTDAKVEGVALTDARILDKAETTMDTIAAKKELRK
jgi:hypothetical protein